MVIIDSRRCIASRGLLAWSVPIEPSWPVFMACKQVERLGSAHLADDDAFGTHTQTVPDEIAHGDLALALEIGRARFQAHHVRLLQLKFGRVFAGDDALFGVDIGGETVQKRRLARTGTAGNQDVTAAAADHAEHARAFGRDRGDSAPDPAR